MSPIDLEQDNSPFGKRHWRPSSSWFDSLNRLPLDPLVLQEFRRREAKRACSTDRQIVLADVVSIKDFARHIGPNLDRLVGYARRRANMANPDQTLLGASPNVPTTQNKITSHGNTFEQRLVDNGIFFNAYRGSTNPANMVEIKSIITPERPELCVSKFTDDDFVYYLMQDQSAYNEATVLSTSFPLIVGKANIPNVRNAPLKRMLDLIKDVTPPQTDLYDGVRPETIAKSVLRQLGGYAQPSTISHHPAMSNFFVECTGPDGTMRVGMRQLSHDLAIGARAMVEFRRFISADNAVDGNAYSFGATYLGGQGILTLFSCHLVSTGNTEQSMQYHVALVASYHLHLDRETFVRGVSAFRNLREFAQRVRERIRDAANLKASSAP